MTFKNPTPQPDREEMKIIPPHRWPAGAEPDERLYSLEASRSMRVPNEIADTALDTVRDEDVTLDDFLVPTEDAAGTDEKPDFERQVGTYVEIAKEARRLNAAQLASQFLAWVFYPAPIAPQAAR